VVVAWRDVCEILRVGMIPLLVVSVWLWPGETRVRLRLETAERFFASLRMTRERSAPGNDSMRGNDGIGN
jgi:hypothetical protein